MQRTYLTSSVKELIQSIARRYQEGYGDSVYLINSSFGSGKTHTLLAIKAVLGKDCNVVSLDGHEIGSTLWDHLCDQYDIECDGPTPATAKKILENRCVILLDELVVHLKRAKAVKLGGTTLDQVTLSFLHTMFALARDYRSVLVITMTDDQHAYSEESNSLLRSLRDITFRQAWTVPPNSRDDYKAILQLQNFTLYNRDVLSDALVELLTFGLSSNPSYQGLRSALRILSKCDITKINEGAIQVTPADLPIEDELFEELAVRLGHGRLGAAMQEDISMHPESAALIRCIYLATISAGGISKDQLQRWLQDGRYTTTELHRIINQSASLYIHRQGDFLSYSINDSILKKIIKKSQNLDPFTLHKFTRDMIITLLQSPEFSLQVFDWQDGIVGKPVLIVPSRDVEAELALQEAHERNNVFVFELGDTHNLDTTISLMLASKELEADDIYKLYRLKLVSDFAIAYPRILYYDSGSLKTLSLGLPMSSIGKHIYKLLLDRSVILDSLSPEYIDFEEAVTLNELYAAYCRNTMLRTLASRKVLHTALKEGERLGLFEERDGKWAKATVKEEVIETSVECRPTDVRKYLSYTVHNFSISVTSPAAPSALVKCVNLLRLLDKDMVGEFFLTSQRGESKVNVNIQQTPIHEANLILKSVITKKLDNGAASLSIYKIDHIMDEDFLGMLNPMLELATSVTFTISNT